MIRGFLRLSGVLIVSTGLAACGLAPKGSIGDPNFWDSSPLLIDSEEAEMGLAELAKGNYGMAEAHFKKALDRDDRDVDALIGLGILYQNTGQLTKAQESYEAVLAIRPSNTQQMVVWQELNHRPISELASVNLALIQGGGVTSSMAMAAPAYNPPPNGAMPGTIGGAASGSPMMGRAVPASAPLNGSTGMAASAGDPAMVARLSERDGMVVSRFATLKTLRDQGLITPEEFRTRRQANVGALLPLSSPPPAAGLDRPVPGTDQITGRLRAIGRALEMRAITISQHGAEREMILNALMPSAPVSVESPAVPPQDLMMAADTIRRLENLQAAGLISSEEYMRERSAIEQSIQAKPGARVASADATSGAATPSREGGPQPALHLASYRSQQAADRGWAQLRRAHQALIGEFEPEVSRVDLGPGKGVYYRLKAGPVTSQGEVQSLCQQLKARRQYCEPSFMGAG